MTNLRYAKYGPNGEQIDDPSLEIPAPQFAVDSSNNVTGLVGPGGVKAITIGAGALARVSRNVVLVGDSILATYEDSQAATAHYANADGTVSLEFASACTAIVGNPIRVNGAATEALNTQSSTVLTRLAVAPYTITYSAPTVSSPVTGQLGVFFPKNDAVTGIASWLKFLIGSPVNILNAAAGGATTDQASTLFSRWLAVNTQRIDDVVVSALTNDMYGTATFAQCQTSMIALLAKARATNARVYVILPTPRDATHAAWTSGKRDLHIQVNKWLWDYCLQNGFCPIDSWRAQANSTTYVNSAATQPDPATGFAQSDKVHPASVGSLAVASDLAAAMQGQRVAFGKGFRSSHSTMRTKNNILPNPTLAGTGGTVTAGSGTISGTAPDSYTVSNNSGNCAVTLTSPARTVAADGDASGYNLSIAVASGTGEVRVANSTSMHASVTAGQVYRLRVPVACSSLVGLTGIEALIHSVTPGGTSTAKALTGTSSAIAGTITGVLTTEDFTVSSGLTSLNVFIKFTFSSGSGTIVMSPPSLDLVE